MASKEKIRKETIALLAPIFNEAGVHAYLTDKNHKGHTVLKFFFNGRDCQFVIGPSGDPRARLNNRTELRKLLKNGGLPQNNC